MNIKRNLILLIVVLVSFSTAFGQNTKKGDKAYDSNEFYKAIEEYTIVMDQVQDPSTKSLLRYRIAESYRKMNRPEMAEKAYLEAIKGGYMSSEVYYGYGDVLLKQGKYDEAQKAFETYKRYSPSDKLGEIRLAQSIYGKANQIANPHFTLQPVETLNTRGSEYGLAYFNDALIYASTGGPEEETPSTGKKSGTNSSKISLRTGLGYSKIYMSVPINGTYNKGEEAIGLNTNAKINEGTFTYDPVSNRGYFTKCDAGDNQCYIYYAEFKAGKWNVKDRLPIDGRKQPIGHPCIALEGKRVYFTSQMEGGYGMSDIWYIDRLPDGNWSKAINVGREVNTPGNDVFPFVTDGYLFYASNGHADGFGGLDIYASKIDGNAHGPAYNIGQPFNSSFDDLNLIVRNDLAEGMMISSRRGEKSNDDIFRFQGFPHALIATGLVYDSISTQPLPNATVEVLKDGKIVEKFTTNDSGTFTFYAMPETLYEITGQLLGYNNNKTALKTTAERFGKITDIRIPLNRTDAYISGKIYDKKTGTTLGNFPVVLYANGKQIRLINSNADGSYTFDDVKENTEYLVKAVRKDYYADTKSLSVNKIDRSINYCKATGFDMDIYLEKIELNKQIKINNIYYDYGKATLRPESLIELDKIIRDVLNKNPQMKIQISSHTDARGSARVNQKLSEERAKSVVDYLVSRGISRERLTAKGYGKNQLLIKKAKTEAEHEQNRRTTFMITGLLDIPLFDTELSGGSATISVPVGSGGGSITSVPGANVAAPSTAGGINNPAANMPFRLQLAASRTLNLNRPEFEKLATQLNLQVYYEEAGGVYRYLAGGFNTREEAEAMARKVKSLGVDCIVKAK